VAAVQEEWEMSDKKTGSLKPGQGHARSDVFPVRLSRQETLQWQAEDWSGNYTRPALHVQTPATFRHAAECIPPGTSADVQELQQPGQISIEFALTEQEKR